MTKNSTRSGKNKELVLEEDFKDTNVNLLTL